MSVPVSRRFPIRRSTLVLVVAFLGLGTVLYFNPPQSDASGKGAVVGGYFVPGAVAVSTTTTTPPTTTTVPPRHHHDHTGSGRHHDDRTGVPGDHPDDLGPRGGGHHHGPGPGGRRRRIGWFDDHDDGSPAGRHRQHRSHHDGALRPSPRR